MKKFLIPIVALFLSISTTFISCTPKDEPYDPAIELTDGSEEPSGFTAFVDGKKYISQNTVGVIKPGNVLMITSYKVGGEAIEIKLTNPKVGTMVLNSNDNNSNKITYKESSSADIFSAYNTETKLPTGTITITKLDMGTRRVSGTFSFTGFLNGKTTPTKAITQGTFSEITFFVQ